MRGHSKLGVTTVGVAFDLWLKGLVLWLEGLDRNSYVARGLHGAAAYFARRDPNITDHPPPIPSGFIKVSHLMSDGRILGASIVGPSAGELTAEVSFNPNPLALSHRIFGHPVKRFAKD